MMASTGRYIRPLALIAAVQLVACSSVYYNTLERFGIEKRDILVDRVTDARDSQQEARDQFSSALDEFTALVNLDGGDLEETYESMQAEFEASQEHAERVQDRIEAVEDVSGDLFAEWEEELELYTDPELRASSAQTLSETRQQYQELIDTMHNAADRMDPVLNAFQDQVLFLRHNLNSQAIASLQEEFNIIEGNITELIRNMEISIERSNRFIEEMNLI